MISSMMNVVDVISARCQDIVLSSVISVEKAGQMLMRCRCKCRCRCLVKLNTRRKSLLWQFGGVEGQKS